MADTQTPTPAQLLADSIPNDIHAELMKQTQALAHKHVTVSYLLMGILVFVLCCGGVGAYFAAKWVDRQLARAEKAEEAYKADKATSDKLITDLGSQLKDSEAARAASDQKIVDLTKQIATIAANAQAEKNKVLQPGKTANDAYSDLSHLYPLKSQMNITKTADGTEQMLSFLVPDVQQFSAAAIDRDAWKATAAAKDGVITQKDVQITSLGNDLVKAKDALTALQTTDQACQVALNDYKKVAKKTKWQKIWGGMKTGIEIGGAIVFGYEIGHLGAHH